MSRTYVRWKHVRAYSMYMHTCMYVCMHGVRADSYLNDLVGKKSTPIKGFDRNCMSRTDWLSETVRHSMVYIRRWVHACACTRGCRSIMYHVHAPIWLRSSKLWLSEQCAAMHMSAMMHGVCTVKHSTLFLDWVSRKHGKVVVQCTCMYVHCKTSIYALHSGIYVR